MYGPHPSRVHHLPNTMPPSCSFLKEGGKRELTIYFFLLIPLFCFPYLHSECLHRDENVLDNLLTHTINADFALKSMIGEAELLIFTSLQLPQNFHSESKTLCIQCPLAWFHIAISQIIPLVLLICRILWETLFLGSFQGTTDWTCCFSCSKR